MAALADLGREIGGIAEAEALEDVLVFHRSAGDHRSGEPLQIIDVRTDDTGTSGVSPPTDVLSPVSACITATRSDRRISSSRLLSPSSNTPMST